MPLSRQFPTIVVLIATLVAAPAWGQASGPSETDGNAIVAVIQSQLDAFKGDRAVEAFGYASPGIQSMFQTPDRFMKMVRNGYSAVYRPREVQFLDLIVERGELAQRVLFVGPDGVPVIAHYYMERQPDGSWRISGVTLHPSADRTT